MIRACEKPGLYRTNKWEKVKVTFLESTTLETELGPYCKEIDEVTE